MRYVSFALAAEGPTDQVVFRVLTARTLEQLFLKDDVPTPFEFDIFDGGKSSNDRVGELMASGEYDLVLVHRDGGSSPEEVADAIRGLGSIVVPIAPRREMESWLLADCVAICQCAGRATNCPLRESECGRHAEALPDPKAELRSKLARCSNRPDRIPDLLEIVATTVRLDLLAKFDSYRRFAGDLGLSLQTLGWPYR